MAKSAPGDGRIKARPNGTFQLDVQYKGRKKSFYAKTKREITGKRDRWKAEVDGGLAVVANAEKQTVREFFENWLTMIKPSGLGVDNTYRGYERAVKLYIVPELGNVRLVKLGVDDLVRLYAKIGRRRRMAKYVHQTLRRGLGVAQTWNHISRNVAALVPEKPDYRADEIEPPSVDEVRRLLDACKTNPRLHAFVVLMAHTGARPSEILGLNAEDIDVAAGVVRIEKTRAFVGPPVERTTKTRKSRRAIAAPRAVLETVLAQAEPAGPLFTTSRGTVVRGPQVSYEFRRAAESVGLSLRLYDLRHFHATQLLAAGIPLHEVSWRLGHGSVSITADIYAHWVPARDQEASSAIGRILGDGA